MKKIKIILFLVIVLFVLSLFIARFVNPDENVFLGTFLVYSILSICGLICFLYFLPTYIAIKKQHKFTLQISLLNTFLGFSLLGWVAALIWATIDNKAENVDIKTPIILIFLTYLITIIIWFMYLHRINSYEYKMQKINQELEQQKQETYEAIKILQESYN